MLKAGWNSRQLNALCRCPGGSATTSRQSQRTTACRVVYVDNDRFKPVVRAGAAGKSWCLALDRELEADMRRDESKPLVEPVGVGPRLVRGHYLLGGYFP